MGNIQKSLQGIYKANQCSDESDINIALEKCAELCGIYGRTKAIERRIVSLKFKRDILLKNGR